tara:strand:- start:896 stop:1099 length:204 start_codon:yes stop_codon:yes gene_type:complete
MASYIEHSLVVLSSVIKRKYNDDNLYNIIRKLASSCTDAGFPEEDGFGGNHKSNKVIAEITKEIEKL